MNKYSQITKLNMILTAIVGISFFLFPCVSIAGYFECSFGSAIFKINSFFNALGEYIGAIDEVRAVYIVLLLYTASFYLILYGVIHAFYYFYKYRNPNHFNRLCSQGYLFDLGTVIVFFIIRFIIQNRISSELNSYYGGLGGIGGEFFSSIFRLGFGFYVILLAGIIGFLLPKFISETKTQTVYPSNNQPQTTSAGQINNNIKNMISTGKDIFNKQTSRFSGRAKEATGDLLPVIMLKGDKQSIPISNLPSIIGRNRQEVDCFVYDNTISRQHCQLLTYDNFILLKDLNSAYGTYLNNEKVEPGNFYRIEDGDILKLGNLDFRVHINKVLLENKIKNQQNLIPNQPTPPQQNKVPVMMYMDKMDGTPDKVIENNQDAYYRQNNPNSSKNNGERTMALNNKSDYGETIKLNYEGGDTRFPIMALHGIAKDNLYLVNKTPFIIGTDVNRTDGQIRETGVSKRHLKIERIDNEFYITDLNSTNGIRINRKTIPPDSRYPLHVGDLILIGELEYRFEEV